MDLLAGDFLMSKLVDLKFSATIMGVGVVSETAKVPLELLLASNDETLRAVVRQQILKLIPTLGIRNMDQLRASLEREKVRYQKDGGQGG